ncbi:lipopolysaccharide/colanic/teichoic acid biosynthesis glycosyltransferase [Flavobacterium limicola]|uniref:Lipopolysaccharide/colanic/teichoic acid biosynthesis glycosyltransferase n=1 Tax=Flavobacterium limicola TaxID=180441 RepID=A0A495RQ88_9FLAO|nr:sugar transferase [Flavobacterium limicola]RKS89733.1 lipopolysaccharide/colanic/teichoic acid biosynthesis glycosyltransferase [Flavobacterium limicola]
MTKRLFDIVFSLFTLLLFFWVLLISWLLAAIDTSTHGIFTQKRIGQYGVPFKIYKLRTIRTESHTGQKYISRIGQFLRRFKLDEMPQLFIVLNGEMSIVGPRPDLPGYYDLLTGENRKILELKPGLTCLASIKYNKEEFLLQKQESPLVYNDSIIFPDKVRLNLAYYYNRSFWGDLVVIWNTVWVVFFRKK